MTIDFEHPLLPLGKKSKPLWAQILQLLRVCFEQTTFFMPCAPQSLTLIPTSLTDLTPKVCLTNRICRALIGNAPDITAHVVD